MGLIPTAVKQNFSLPGAHILREHTSSLDINTQNTTCLYYVFISDLVDFSDEEGYGKYLDLHEAYDKYINIKGIEVSVLTNSLHLLCGRLSH